DLVPPSDLRVLDLLPLPVVPTCADRIANQGESDVDCGGPCAEKCLAGEKCAVNGDCATGSCVAQRCHLAVCPGGGTFAPKVASPAAGPAPNLALGDIDADGDVDLVLANANNTSTVSLLLNQGNGTFGPKTDYATGSAPSVAIADLTGDGIGDLLVNNFGA